MTKSPLPTLLVFTQNKEATHPRIGLGLGSQLTPSKTASPLFFFRLHWLEHGRCPCSSENLAGTFKKNHTDIYMAFNKQKTELYVHHPSWHSRTFTTATLFCPGADSPYIYSYLNLFTTTTATNIFSQLPK